LVGRRGHFAKIGASTLMTMIRTAQADAMMHLAAD
jgi:hypothetical protein